MKYARFLPILLALPLPASAATNKATGLWLFLLLYIVGFIFAVLLLFIFAQKGQQKKDK